ncbi:TetR/AcrR family transcriptional regulator [Granulicella sp. WH15]|uniref:TetR/AcrR family transcriptional regulator n=1 Tax=Granulicella sp. WH15 TaxID=2602070 RepID=UPI0013A566A9|nr:TetR/AcrR family transcriptional regulator [Granulicella sp. WH15]
MKKTTSVSKTSKVKPRASVGSGSGRPPAKQAAARMENILSAAAEIFLQEGFDRASVGSIARLAGASTETLYSKFSTKEELFQAVITRKTEILLQKFSRVLVQNQPIEKVLERYGSNLLDFMLLPEMQRLSRTLIAAAPQFPELAGDFWRLCPEREQAQLAEYLETQIAAGILVPFNCRKVAESFFSLCLGQFLVHAYMFVRKVPNTAERKQHVALAVHMFMAAYGRPTGRKQ